MSTLRRYASLLVLSVVACGPPVEKAAKSEESQPAGAAASHHAPHPEGVWGLDVTSQGPFVDLLLATAGEGGVRLLHQRSLDGGRSWSSPVEIPTHSFAMAHGHRGSDPQIAAHGNDLLVAWTARGSSPWGTGPIGTARSRDGGKS